MQHLPASVIVVRTGRVELRKEALACRSARNEVGVVGLIKHTGQHALALIVHASRYYGPADIAQLPENVRAPTNASRNTMNAVSRCE
jgi:hypothetical protein